MCTLSYKTEQTNKYLTNVFWMGIQLFCLHIRYHMHRPNSWFCTLPIILVRGGGTIVETDNGAVYAIYISCKRMYYIIHCLQVLPILSLKIYQLWVTVTSLVAHSWTTSPCTVWCAAVLIPLFLLTQVCTTSPLQEAQRWLSPYKVSPVVRCTTARQQLSTLTLHAVLVQWLEVWRYTSILYKPYPNKPSYIM